MTIQAVLSQTGNPLEAIELKDKELPPPAHGEARIRMSHAAINPADINVLEGVYPVTPGIGGIPGNEGCGYVEEVNGNSHVKEGDLVIIPSTQGAWTQERNVDLRRLVKVPEGISEEQAAMLSVNPPTAYLMLTTFRVLNRGDWIVQNAANSGVGQYVIKLAKRMGINTVNVVRREDQVEALKDIGATEVFLESDDFHREAKKLAADKKIYLAFNAVGGDNAAKVARCLSDGGIHVTYGAMSKQPFSASNGSLIFKDIQYRGFWVTRWFRKNSKDNIRGLFKSMFNILQPEAFSVDVDKVYDLENIKEALEHSSQSSRSGKVLLKLN